MTDSPKSYIQLCFKLTMAAVPPGSFTFRDTAVPPCISPTTSCHDSTPQYLDLLPVPRGSSYHFQRSNISLWKWQLVSELSAPVSWMSGDCKPLLASSKANKSQERFVVIWQPADWGRGPAHNSASSAKHRNLFGSLSSIGSWHWTLI